MARTNSVELSKSATKKPQKPLKISSASKSNLGLAPDLCKNIFSLMVKSRALEERLIKIYKSGEVYFWIGAPGEEAFGVSLGLLVNKGQGIQHDYLHLHYRGTPTLVAMGMPMIDSIRLIMNRSTDRCTGGRNFSNHYCFPEWNVAPVTSPIEVQYNCAIGTAWVQKREKAKGISIITGGDAGTAEGDFASCLVWSSRKGNELPMLITVQNNKWGISTDFDSQHGERNIADRGKAFGMRTVIINGNDPVESYISLKSEIDYIKKNKKPVLLEARVSRLYGHSSASGASKVEEEDCVLSFQEKILSAGLMKKKEVDELWANYEKEARDAQEKVRLEPAPKSNTIWDHVYFNNENSDWRNF